MAASFIGWCFVTSTAEPSPVYIVSNIPASPNQAPTLIERMANSTFLFFQRNQQLTPITNTPESAHPLRTAWKNLLIAIPETVPRNYPLRFASDPGQTPCQQDIASMRWQRESSAEMEAPSAVSEVEARWKRGLTLFHPKT